MQSMTDYNHALTSFLNHVIKGEVRQIYSSYATNSNITMDRRHTKTLRALLIKTVYLR
jgi:hypothetical protein